MPLDLQRQKTARSYARIRRALFFVLTGYSALIAVAGIVAFAAGWIDPGIGLPFELDVLALFTCLFVVYQVLTFPLDLVQGHVLPRRYGLSVQSLRSWLADWAKALGIGFALGAVAVSGVYWLLRWTPDWWWLPAGIGALLFTVVLAHLAPVLLLPLFYRLRPLDDRDLAERLTRLAERSGASVRGVYTMNLSAKGTGANAALMGWGNTRRIVLTDTLLERYSAEEIEVILAHELGHHTHGDIPRLIVLQSVSTLLGFVVVHFGLSLVGPALGVTPIWNPAGMPLFALILGAYGVLSMPGLNAISRLAERAADRFALERTGLAAAFVSAMDKLTDQNLAESRPPRWAELLFASHPPHARRVAMAQEYLRQGAL